MRHRQALLVIRSRQLRGAGIARTDRNCSGSGAIRSRRSGVVGHRSPARAAAIHDHESTRLAYALPERVPSTSWSSSFPSPCWVRAERRGPEPPRGQQIETRPPGWWGNARRSTAPAPQSKPVTPPRASWRRSRRRWHLGLGPRILAAGPARNRHYSYRGRLCEPDLKSSLGLVRGSGQRLIPRQRPGRLPPSLPREARTGGHAQHEALPRP